MDRAPTTALNATTKTITLTGSTTAGKINLVAPTIQLNTNTFKYIPWTYIITGVNGTSASLTNVINYTSNGTGSNLPTCSTTAATIKYRYSVIGNTLYLNYFFNQSSGGTGGSGNYQYQFPNIPGITINTTEFVSYYSGNAPSTVYQQSGGTKIGNAGLRVTGTGIATIFPGSVIYTNMGGINGFVITPSNGPTTFQCESSYSYSSGPYTLHYTFEVSVSIS